MAHGLRTRPAGTDVNGSDRRMSKRRLDLLLTFFLSDPFTSVPARVRSPWGILDVTPARSAPHSRTRRSGGSRGPGSGRLASGGLIPAGAGSLRAGRGR